MAATEATVARAHPVMPLSGRTLVPDVRMSGGRPWQEPGVDPQIKGLQFRRGTTSLWVSSRSSRDFHALQVENHRGAADADSPERGIPRPPQRRSLVQSIRPSALLVARGSHGPESKPG